MAGHDSCELRRHLDSVPPETPIRDIVDCCRMWESHADVWRISKPGPDQAFPTYVVSDSERETDDRKVAAVTTSQSTPDQLETALMAACWSSRAGTTPETGASYCGTGVTALVSGGSGSKACPGHGDWEF